jgi:hypothetical protein
MQPKCSQSATATELSIFYQDEPSLFAVVRCWGPLPIFRAPPLLLLLHLQFDYANRYFRALSSQTTIFLLRIASVAI